MKQHGRTVKMVMQVCQCCGEEFPIWRKRSRLKDGEHIKPLYCLTCGKRTPHKQKEEWQ